MSKSEARRQKQLAKKKAKRAEKRSALARLNSADPFVRLAGAGSWPIENVLMPSALWDDGIGQLTIARRMPDGRIACGAFLVDTYCLGVKDAFWKIMPPHEYEEFLLDSQSAGSFRPVTPEYFVKLVEGAVDYARGLGFAPPSDYRHARLLLDGIDPSLCPDTFEFGNDGQPLYMRGPNESLAEARSISARVQKAGGKAVIPMAESEPETLEIDCVSHPIR